MYPDFPSVTGVTLYANNVSIALGTGISAIGYGYGPTLGPAPGQGNLPSSLFKIQTFEGSGWNDNSGAGHAGNGGYSNRGGYLGGGSYGILE